MAKPVDVLIVGGGMITHDQLLPSIYHLQRLGYIGDIRISALNARPLKELAEAPGLLEAFPGQSFQPIPDFNQVDLDESFPELYKEAIASLEPGNAVVVAVPDHLHYPIVLEAMNRNQHILCVKPLVQKYNEAVEIERIAKSKQLFVGVEYHKRFDRRALLARKDYAAGKFGEFKIGEARLVEPWLYRASNFQNWFTKEHSDPFTYIGCHYVDQVYFITGLRPIQVSVRGLEGIFPNGNIGYFWSLGVVTFENESILSVINGLGYPDEGAGSNDQGLTLFCEGEEKGAVIRHNDQFRGVIHSYLTDSGPGGTHYNFVNPD
ncbi:MAG: Gfo/Idh/MocA family oxidoreductase, partial [bacterium]